MITSAADLVAFLKRFHQCWLTEPALDPDLIPADLPAPLALVYRELGALVEIEQGPHNDWRAPFAAQDALVPLRRLKWVEGMLEFAWENQGNWSARCPIGQPDPPVFSNAGDLWQTVRRGFIPVCDSLTHFLITLCLQEAVMSSPSLAALPTNRSVAELLNLPLKPLWLQGRYVAGEPDHQFFVSFDEDVLVMDWAGLWVGSLSRSAAQLIVPGVKMQVLH